LAAAEKENLTNINGFRIPHIDGQHFMGGYDIFNDSGELWIGFSIIGSATARHGSVTASARIFSFRESPEGKLQLKRLPSFAALTY
jgi:hypothetical protein